MQLSTSSRPLPLATLDLKPPVASLSSVKCTAARQPRPMNILVIDDDPNIRKTVRSCLESLKHSATVVTSPRNALAEVSGSVFQLALIDIRLGLYSGLDLLPRLAVASPWTKIVVMTAYASIETAVEAVRRGAFDYLPKPFSPAQVELLIRKIMDADTAAQKAADPEDELRKACPEALLSSASYPMQQALALAQDVAKTEATVLLRGESGAGKSVMAQAIHLWSSRAGKPFVVASCPAMPEQLLEKELFGDVAEAPTGAAQDHPVRLMAGEDGTIFFDEIAELPLGLQAKLLRFIQEGVYERGGSVAHQRNMRVIAATKQDLALAVKEGRFREELYYRLNVMEIKVPPLRERREDIAPLAEHLLAFFARRNQLPARGFTSEALQALQQYSWPGNVRELRNTVERAAILCRTERAGPDLLPGTIVPQMPGFGIGSSVSLQQIEEAHIRRVVATAPSLEKAAEILGIDQATLWRRRKEYDI
ncbi:MAG: sigma-54 dependent transcriptional regulator [Planctomycetota bacterium]